MASFRNPLRPPNIACALSVQYYSRRFTHSGRVQMRSVRASFMMLLALGMIVPAFGQTVSPPVSGIDLSGSWFPGRHQDSTLGTAAGSMVDWGGIPLNEANRLYGLSWSASRITVRQHQCAGYVPPYFYYAPGNYRFWEERDPDTQRLIAIKMYAQI